MRQGYTLVEMAIVLGIAGLVMSLTAPRIGDLMDRLAVERAASRVTTGLAVARSRAVLETTRARLTLGSDSLRVDIWQDEAWAPVARWPGPESDGVTFSASNPVVTFDALGLAWGLSNTTIQLSRRSHTATITASRLGRIKRA